MPDIIKSSPPSVIKPYQLALEELDFPLPRYGADGYFGNELLGASHDAAAKYGFPKPSKNVIPAALVDPILKIAAGGLLPPMPKEMVDISSWAYPGPRDHRVAIASWKGITPHTSGCLYGPDSWNEEEMHQRLGRFTYKNDNGKLITTSLKAHAMVTRSTPGRKAQIVLVHPIDWFVWHAQQLSLTEIGLEIETFCLGDLSNPKTLPSGNFKHHEATDEQIELTRIFYRWVNDTLVALRGYGITSSHPHRWSAQNRTYDCGERIYKAVILWAQQTFGVDSGKPGSFVGKGKPTPDVWTGQKNGIKL